MLVRNLFFLSKPLFQKLSTLHTFYALTFNCVLVFFPSALWPKKLLYFDVKEPHTKDHTPCKVTTTTVVWFFLRVFQTTVLMVTYHYSRNTVSTGNWNWFRWTKMQDNSVVWREYCVSEYWWKKLFLCVFFSMCMLLNLQKRGGGGDVIQLVECLVLHAADAGLTPLRG